MSDPEFSLAGAEALVRSAQANYEAALSWAKHSEAQAETLRVVREELAVALSGLDRAKIVIQTTGAARDAAQERVVELEAEVDRLQALVDGSGGGGGTGPPSASRPGEDLDWHVVDRPSDTAIDWIVDDGILSSTRGLGSTPYWGTAYRMSRSADPASSTVVFGVHGWAHGEPVVGGHFGTSGGDHIAWNGEQKASATFIGLTDDACVRLTFASPSPSAGKTGDVRCYDIGLRGAPDSHMIRAVGGCDNIQLDRCWYVHHDPKFDYQAALDGRVIAYSHSLSLVDHGSLVIRYHRWRGRKPSDYGLLFRYYSVAYVHGGRVSTLIEGCNLRGGGRGGFQDRAEHGEHPTPNSHTMLRGNFLDERGLDAFGTDGGACLTAWQCAGGLYVYDNVIRNFRWSAVVLSGQSQDRNFADLRTSGRQFGDVHVDGNLFERGPSSMRATAKFSNADELHLGANQFDGDVFIDDYGNWERGNADTGKTMIYSSELPDWALHTYIPNRPNASMPLSDSEIGAMLTEGTL